MFWPRVQVIDKTSGDVYWINAEDCGFAYKSTSYFKGQMER